MEKRIATCTSCGVLLDEPEKCDSCHNYFCSEHINPKNHGCHAKIKIPSEVIAFVFFALFFAVYFYYNPNLLSSIIHFIPAMISSIISNTEEVGKNIVPKPTPKPEYNETQIEMEIHDLINKERTNGGLKTLSWSAQLSDIARGHSEDMAVRNYFSHYDLEGRDMSYRYSKAGYECKILIERTGNTLRYAAGAENIFQNNLYSWVTYVNDVPSYDWSSQQYIAESTVKGWMESTGHRENIMTSYWKSEGIGIAISSDNKVYITENFC